MANTAWAFAMLKYRDDKLLLALTIVAEQLPSEFNAQEIGNTTWAFATVNLRYQKVFAALARAA